MNTRQINKKRGISPIIATLLLILIAIAAGVVVYAYVIGFIGNSTQNSGATTDTLSIDQVSFSSKTASFPVTAYVRNEGPSTESFNTGFFVKGSSLNDQLVPALSISTSTTLDTISNITIGARTNGTLSVTIIAGACTSGTFTINGFGATRTISCTASPGLTTSLAVSGITFSNGTSIRIGTVQFTSPYTFASTGTNVVFGISVVGTGTMSTSVNTVGPFTLAMPATVAGPATNPLSPGQTYTFQVTGTDGGSATASNKAT